MPIINKHTQKMLLLLMKMLRENNKKPIKPMQMLKEKKRKELELKKN